jgi:hypothetical protein
MLVCGIFYDGVSISEYTAPNEGMIGEELIGKDFEGSGCGLRETDPSVDTRG